MMMKVEHEVELAGQVRSVEVHVDSASLYWDNNGIGAYEFWGQKGFDRGQDYISEFTVDRVLDLDDLQPLSEALRSEVEAMLHEDEDFIVKLEDEVKNYLSEMRAEAELDRRESLKDSIFD